MKKLLINRTTIDEINSYESNLRDYVYYNNLKMNYFFLTFGCQMNSHDSERMAAILESVGFTESETIEGADIIIINTCAVRENAEERVFGKLGELKRLKKKNKNLIIGLCGCMAQQEHIRDRINNSFPYVNLIFGTHNYFELAKYILEILKTNNKVHIVFDDSGSIIEGLSSIRKNKVTAFVNIMEGCNNFCSFCIVPYTRGREKSRTSEEIIKEINQLVSDGVKEVTLLGQNVNSYGRGLEEEITFPELLKKINDLTDIKRIRFMTSHPKDLSDELIYAIRDLPKVCEYLHLPVQSGSSRILKKMNRRYTKEMYLEKIDKLKRQVPEITLSTDIMMGFPGETMEDVNETIDLIKKVQYDSAFTFIYSKRNNTPAAKMDDDVDEKMKHERFELMLDALNPIVEEKNRSYLGKTLEVLVESEDKGRSRGHSLINLTATPDEVGEILDVKIVKTKRFSLVGEIIR